MPGQVYAVASGKGGVGKTTTSVNLGVAIRAAGHSVVLVDADLGMANLATILGIEHDPTLHDVLAGEASLGDALIRQAQGFAILPGSRELSSFADADPQRLEEVVDALADRFEYVIVDSGAGLSYEDVLPLALADRIILVSSPSPASIGDTRKTVELADLVDAAIRGVVVTFVDDAVDEAAIADEIGVELLAAIPDDPAVTESATAGEPLAAHAPDSPAAQAYARLAAVIVGEEAPPDTPSRGRASATGAGTESGTDDTDEPDGTEPGEPDEPDGAEPEEPDAQSEVAAASEPDPEGETLTADDVIPLPGEGDDAADREAGTAAADAGTTGGDEAAGDGGDDTDPGDVDDQATPEADEGAASNEDEDEDEGAEGTADDGDSGGFLSRIAGLFR